MIKKYNFLDFILLFLLSFDFTRAFDKFKVSTFDVKLYPLYFFLLIIYFLLSLSQKYNWKSKINIPKFKLFLLVIIIVLTVIKTFYSAINLRHIYGNKYPVHDNPIQIEEAIKYLKQGKNPYTENYIGTPQEYWYETGLNMALWHVVTLPFYLISSLLISYPSIFLFGYFDQRMVHALLYILSIYLIHKLIKPIEKKIIYLTLFIFNPYLLNFFIEGRNDIFVFSLIFLSLYLLSKNKFKLSALSLGLAFSSKQSSWLIFPFYFFYLYFKENEGYSFVKKLKNILIKTWPFFISIIIFIIPFLIWDSKSFIEDIYLYPGGGLSTSYPISGMGVSIMLLRMGIIASDNSAFPSTILQFIFCIPVMIFLLSKLKKHPRISFLTFSYTIFLFIFWIFSRFFADNYLGYIITLVIMGMIFLEKEEQKQDLLTKKNKLISEKSWENS